MKIPEKVKIGGKTYTVKITDNISLGRVGYSAEIDYLNLEIRIQPSAKEKMEADFLHEVMHGIFDFLGYKEHDEKHIDELAQSFYMIVQDNPEIFGDCHKPQWETVEAVLYNGDRYIQVAIDHVYNTVKTPELKSMLSEMRESIYNTNRETAYEVRKLLGCTEGESDK